MFHHCMPETKQHSDTFFSSFCHHFVLLCFWLACATFFRFFLILGVTLGFQTSSSYFNAHKTGIMLHGHAVD